MVIPDQRVFLRLSERGGDEETRTPDPLLAKEMLFQLSYVPVLVGGTGRGGRFWTRTRDLCLIRAVLYPAELNARRASGLAGTPAGGCTITLEEWQEQGTRSCPVTVSRRVAIDLRLAPARSTRL